MDSMRRLLLCVLFGALLLLGAQAAFAANEIVVTVTLQQIGVDVSPTSWPLGVMAPTTSQSSWVSTVAGYFGATNTGNVPVDFTIEPGSTSPSGWTAETSVAVDDYVIGFGIGTEPYTTEPAYTTFTGSTSLATGVAAAETVDFDLEFTAPATGSTYDAGGESFTVSLGASPS